MSNLKSLAIGSAVSAVALFGAPAIAGGHGSTEYSLGVASEYVFRGVPQGSPQVWGAIDWSAKSGLYAGTWLSSTGGEEELDLYGGYTFGGKDLSFDVGAIGYLFPSDPANEDVNDGHGNNGEVYGGVTTGPFNGYVYYNFGTDIREDDEFVYVDLNLDIGKIGLHVGYTVGTGDFFDTLNEDSYLDIGVSCNTDLGKAGEITWAVTWTDLDSDNDMQLGAAPLGINDRPQFTVGWSNSWGGK